MKPRIAAMTVNQNTSCYTELMLRSLLASGLPDARLTVAILDNGSTDEHLAELADFVGRNGWDLVRTGLGDAVASEKHALALTKHIGTMPETDYIMLLDCDIWFHEDNTAGVMLEELASAGTDCFANQAQIRAWRELIVIEGADRIPGRTPYENVTWMTTVGSKQYETRLATRCSPICCLIRDSKLFRKVIETIGLSCSHIYTEPGTACFYDTMALATHVLKSHDREFLVSARSVMHFGGVLSHQEHAEEKKSDCLQKLARLRAAQGPSG